MEPKPNLSDNSSQMPTEAPAAGHAPGQVFAPSQPQPAPQSAEPAPADAQLLPNSLAAERPVAVALPGQNTTIINGETTNTPLANVPPPPGTSSKGKRFSRKAIMLPAAAVLVLLGGSAAAYFGYVLPNKPENIWSTALSRTGKGYDKLSQYAQQQFNGKTKGIKLNGSFKISGTLAADGSFQGSSDGDNGEFTGSLSASGLKVDIDTRIIKSAGNTPDIYFKVNGLQGLGSLFGAAAPQAGDALNGLNGNWYFVDHTLFDQYAQGANSDLQFSQSDVKAAIDAVGKSAKQYVFTGDQSKMAFVIKQQIGKEKQDGRSVYHYKIGINKANLKAFNNSLCDNLKDTKLYKALAGGQTLADCKDTKDIDRIKDSDSADAWVDLHTKLIHKIRFTDSSNKDSYFDIGQDYQGGDSFPFSLGFQTKTGGQTSQGVINLSLNTKTNIISIDGNAKDGGDSGMSGSFKMTISPNNVPVKVDKPANAKTIIQLLNDLGFGDIYSGVQSSAKDTERKTDINALQGQLEAYFAENGYYPTLASLNDTKWRAQNLKGLDSAALKDPDGASGTLSAKLAKGSYAYTVVPANCDNGTHGNCNSYTLSATLDDGTVYAKQSLNSEPSLPSVVN